jgi:glycosyltransferase involved in cell wall biosynthesis
MEHIAPSAASAAPNLAFGSAAAAWAARLAAAMPIVSADLRAVPFAFVEAARRRKSGQPFGAAVFFDEPRAHCALYVAAPPVLAQVTDYDERARLLDSLAIGGLQIGGKEQREIERIEPQFLRCAAEFLTTADVVVTRSSVERERLCAAVGRRFAHVAIVAPPDPSVPPPPDVRGRRDAIVVWAPHMPAEACGLFAFALEEFHRPAFIVCAGGSPPPMRNGTRYIGVADAAHALTQAAVIVDASLSDPGTARALADWGVPLAAASCSGAQDWLDGTTAYDPWNHLSVTAAVANALTGGPPLARAQPGGTCGAEFARVLAASAPPRAAAPPLVSVVVPTRNERASLRDALASIAGQSHPNLELVLVNDGGPPINPQLLTGWRAVQLIELPQRGGVEAALNRGIAAARGAYIAILADDDLYCPDHIARLTCALEQTGGDVAHAIELREHFALAADGTYALIGHTLIGTEPARRTALQLSNPIGGPSVVFSRAAWDRADGFDGRKGLVADLDIWMRFSKHFDFHHVDRVTTVMSIRTDASQYSAVGGPQTAAFYRDLYAAHPTGRPLLDAARADWLQRLETAPVSKLPHITISQTLAGVSPPPIGPPAAPAP